MRAVFHSIGEGRAPPEVRLMHPQVNAELDAIDFGHGMVQYRAGRRFDDDSVYYVQSGD